MTEYALPCVVCGVVKHNVDQDAINQPYEATAFITHGHYGSTAFDPMDGSYLEINICDECIARLTDEQKIMFGRDSQPVVSQIDPKVPGARYQVGWRKVSRQLTIWNGEYDERDMIQLNVEPDEVGTDAWDTKEFKIEWQEGIEEIVQQMKEDVCPNCRSERYVQGVCGDCGYDATEDPEDPRSSSST
jgi:hypothetical protein